MEDGILGFLKEYNRVLIPIVTFLLGFIISRFTLTKDQKLAHSQRQFENGKELMESQKERFEEFVATLEKYNSRKDDPSLDDFYEVSTVGEKYFYQLKISSDAILQGNVANETRDKTLVPQIKEAIEKTLPLFYEALQEISKKKELPYSGSLKRENYESLYTVVEKYA